MPLLPSPLRFQWPAAPSVMGQLSTRMQLHTDEVRSVGLLASIIAPTLITVYGSRKPLLRFVIRRHRVLLRLCGWGVAASSAASVAALASRFGAKGRGLLVAAGAAILAWGYTAKPRFPAPKILPRKLCHDKFTSAKVPNKIDAIVIGSGMGSLTCAATLASMGWRVLVLEAHPDRAGGCTHEYDLGSGWTFDSGFHYGPALQQYSMWWATQSTYHPPVPFDPMLNDEDGVFDKVVVNHEGKEHTLGMTHQETHIADLFAYVKGDAAKCSQLVEYLHCSAKAICMFPLWWLMRFLPYSSFGSQAIRGMLWLLGWHNVAGLTVEEVFKKLKINDPILQAILNGTWQNQGTPPARCAFVMGSAVQRGFPLVTPSYPRGGSQLLARHLAHTVEAAGGKVLHRAKVTRIRTEDARVVGVDVGEHFIAAPVVISGCGYNSTFDQLLDKQLTKELQLPCTMDEFGVRQSCGFVMVNAGIRGTAEELGLSKNNQNLWYHPVWQSGGDFFGATAEFFEEPLGHDDYPLMCTFPSVKNREWHSSQPSHADMTTVQILALAEHQWFATWQHEKSGNRGKAYEELKDEWLKRSTSVLYKYYPQFKGKMEFMDVSTPITAQHYITSVAGSALGLESCPARFTDHKVGKALDMQPWGGIVKGLWMTGQDQFICGVPMAHLSGMVTALRLAGPVSSAAWAFHGARLSFRSMLPFTASP
mmetsp:Transcript_45523/g.90184  ORF Transcript_45523/g.90184 Transcript_45523/m.90184 type:complete len:704 (+) Transcript_45523:51-2162(+)|eukprot:CAMPEP_0172820250 /NCGR_PEP_ID=MMETSP1075-20121228/15138_1 /TAXON_ID=2916 /ORGANISM="Ceratium fusus, Strain PA161109" /LENGTH=703 /DNA_ID=CAMNT_0013660889 /DNA_START=49 /DNA_END=2160 /DNA_ORIENTATION=-